MEHDVGWKTTFNERVTLMEDILEDNLQLKTKFDGRKPLMVDNL